MIDKKDLELKILLKESMIQQLKLKNNQLEERIDKAIEYIENNSYLEPKEQIEHFLICYRPMEDVTEVLNILRGEDDED